MFVRSYCTSCIRRSTRYRLHLLWAFVCGLTAFSCSGDKAQLTDVSGFFTPSVATGSSHTCIVTSGGNVKCWGSAASGRLGYGNTTMIGDNELPSSVGTVNVGGSVLQVTAGSAHTCALLTTGAVRCWGRAAEGQLGYGNTTNIGNNGTNTITGAGDVSVGERVVQISAGGNHTCAVTETGNVVCWGEGANGQLGYGNTNNIGDNEVPSSIGSIRLGGQAVQVSAGTGDYTCAVLNTGNVRCWGTGGGHLGYGHWNNVGDTSVDDIVNAGDLNIGGSVVQVAAGGVHTCALLSNQKVRCWGTGTWGALGYGNQNSTCFNSPDEIVASGDVNVGGPVVQISAGTFHTCAVLSTGGLRCWGTNSFDGQVGIGADPLLGDLSPSEIADLGDLQTGGKIVQVNGSDVHTCAVYETGAIRCWGDGGSGQLGYAATADIGKTSTTEILNSGDISIGTEAVQSLRFPFFIF